MRLIELKLMISFGGICKDKPRAGNAGRRGVEGLSIMGSSLATRAGGSRNFGDGEKIGRASCRERVF